MTFLGLRAILNNQRELLVVKTVTRAAKFQTRAHGLEIAGKNLTDATRTRGWSDHWDDSRGCRRGQIVPWPRRDRVPGAALSIRVAQTAFPP